MDSIAQRGYAFEDLVTGMAAARERTISAADIQTFADVSGDHNPLHVDANFAAGTIFKTCIAHGMLTAGHISAVFGSELPGPGAIYVSQTLNFRAPVRAGDSVVTRVVLNELLPEKRRAVFSCECSVNGKLVLTGEAVLMVPARGS